MVVGVGEERYIIPTLSIETTLRPDAGALTSVAGRGEMVMVQDSVMPLFRLHRLFGIRNAVEDPTDGLVVVVDDGDRSYALVVDGLLGQQQVVAKALGDGVGRIEGVSGGAILGDGRVGLILDASELGSLARQAGSELVTVGAAGRNTGRR